MNNVENKIITGDHSGLEPLKQGKHCVHLIMDYDPGDMAVAEVLDALHDYLPSHWTTSFTKVHSFKTTETGFVAGQLALKPRPQNSAKRILYVNCAPRKDKRESRKNNEGESLVYGYLDSGVHVVAVNSGYSLSVVRDHFKFLYSVKVDRAGSQFRSRDNFPPFVGKLARGENISDYLSEKINPITSIPEFKEGYIGYIDSFGNLKTTYRASSKLLSSLKEGQEVEITINGVEIVAVVAAGLFNVKEGHYAFAPGSSGYDDRFWEIIQRGYSAQASFHYPQVGSEIRLKTL